MNISLPLYNLAQGIVTESESTVFRDPGEILNSRPEHSSSGYAFQPQPRASAQAASALIYENYLWIAFFVLCLLKRPEVADVCSSES